MVFVVSEALANAAKHSQAAEVSVRVISDATGVRLAAGPARRWTSGSRSDALARRDRAMGGRAGPVYVRYVPGTTFLSALRQLADADPDRPALTYADQTLTRAGFVQRVERLAALFAARGVTEGSTVTIGLPNSTGFVESMFAAWALGAVPQPISDRLPPLERAAIVDLADPSLVVGVPPAEGGSRPVLESVPRELPAGSFTPGVSPQWKLMTSGGSTGRPKLIAVTEPALAENVGGAAALVCLRPGGSVLMTGPLAHNAPFVVTTIGMLLGNHIVLMPRFDASETLRLVEKHRVTFLLLVPTMMLRIWRLPETVRLAADVSGLEVAFHLAAPCPAWLKQAWIDWLGPQKVFELYGGTELQAVTVISGTEWLAHRGSVGRTVLGEIEIRDPSGTPAPAGQEGEIWMRRGPGAPGPVPLHRRHRAQRPRRLGVARRHRQGRRGRVRVHHRPARGHDPGRRGERLPGGDRGRPRPASGRAVLLRDRPSGRGPGQHPLRHRGAVRTGIRRGPAGSSAPAAGPVQAAPRDRARHHAAARRRREVRRSALRAERITRQATVRT